jgi:hypothetical protein
MDFKHFFDRRPFQLTHTLKDHGLFDLAELMALARRLPEGNIEYNAGDVPINLDPNLTPRTGLSIEETIRRIRECNSWMVIKYIEQDQLYRNLLEICLGEIGDMAGIGTASMYDKQGFIFISSPGAVTPFHIDPEHNFLFQIRGWKAITVCDPKDRNVLTEQDLEKFFTGGHRNLKFRQEFASNGNVHRLQAGYGLHIPVTAPHWVKNGDEVSISFSVTFQSREIEDRSHIYKVNAVLRKAGITPVAPGISKLRDTAKIRVFNLLRKLKRALAFPIPARPY